MTNHLKVFSFVIYLLCFSSFVCAMNPNSEEDLLYTTLKITCKNTTEAKEGTGFIFNFKEKQISKIQPPFFVQSKNDQFVETVERPYLVTNKHVIKDAISGELNFHLTDDTNVKYTIGGIKSPFSKSFILHDDDVDLCAMPLYEVIGQINNDQLNNNTNQMSWNNLPQQQKRVFYTSLNLNHLVNFEKEDAIQDILMVGYPIGISDEINNLPVVRKGITSSHLRKNFQNKPEVLIDAACFPGSSGSPVFLRQKPESNFFSTKLLGILWGGPQHTVTGNIICEGNKIKCEEIPTTYAVTQIPSNLGFVIKSTELIKIQENIWKSSF
jgi:hypothetical protein